MADISLTDIFLAGMTTYGPVTLALAMFLGTLGIPAPLPILALAAGAFARHGSINWGMALFLALAGATLGDSLGYMVGHFAGQWAQRRFGNSPTWDKALDRFHQNGDLAIFITRFLLTPLAVPTNLIAGISNYPYQQFFVYTVTGTLVFLLFFGGMGYTFGRQWSVVGELVSDYSVWIVGATIVGIVVYHLVGCWSRHKRLRATNQPASRAHEQSVDEEPHRSQ